MVSSHQPVLSPLSSLPKEKTCRESVSYMCTCRHDILHFFSLLRHLSPLISSTQLEWIPEEKRKHEGSHNVVYSTQTYIQKYY